MGHTHYYYGIHFFKQKCECPRAQWAQITQAFQQLMTAALLTDPFPIQREKDDASPPEISENFIIFNGIGNNACETFVLERSGDGLQFCKTNHKPYDRAVMALLLLVNHFAPGIWKVSSDGNANDWSPILNWVNSLKIEKFRLPVNIIHR